MSPNASRQNTGKMTNRPHIAHIQGMNAREIAVGAVLIGWSHQILLRIFIRYPLLRFLSEFSRYRPSSILSGYKP